jgi:hypothetical protein
MKPKFIIIVTILIALVLSVVFWMIYNNDSNDAETEFSSWYPIQNENGDPAMADFENHIPCVDIENKSIENCDRIKFGIVLYHDPQTKAPTTYIISRVHVGVNSERTVNKGTWTTTRGNALDPNAVVYKLDSNAPEEFRNFWALGEDILFILNQEMQPRVGDAAYGYALNRVPLGQVYRVPVKN